MDQPLKVLIAEDNPADAELVVRELRKAGFDPQWRRVDTEPDYIAYLQDPPDIILSDYEMPQFSGLRAFEILKQSGLEVPFIIVSGTIGEDTAVAAMKLGVSDYLLKDRLGRLGAAITHALSETRLKRERIKIAEELRLFRTLIDGSNDILEIIDPATGRFLDVNGKGPAELGYSRDEYLSLHVSDVDETVSATGWVQLAQKIRDAGSFNGEGSHRRKDGTSFPVEFNARWVRNQRDYIVSVVRDISFRRQAESALRASEERFRLLAENIHEVFWISDPTRDTLFYVSPGFEKTWGHSCSTLYARPQLWLDSIHPEDRERIATALKAMPTTENYDEEYRIVRSDGTVRWIRDRAYPIRSTTQGSARLVGVAEDITERKNLHEQFLRSQRMEAVGTLAGGLAHDLNNVLSPILISAPLLREHLKTEETLQILRTIESNVKRGSSIIGRVLSFARGMGGKRVPVDLQRLVREIEEIIFETFPRSIRLETFTSHRLWPVLGDATQLHQALLNLAVNARDAMPEGGILRIKVQNISLGEERLARLPELQPGPHVVVDVSDSGCGISKENLGKIFDPFFTTKEIGKGTGLGLASTLAIIKNHNGHVDVESEPGRGTVFTLYLPAQPQAVPEEAPEATELPSGDGELILVIDDEAPIREVAQKTLEHFGYRVILANNGREGVATFAARSSSISAVITDMMMPQMNGEETITELRRIKANVPIVAVSGLDVAVEGVRVLAKPFTAEAMLRILHSTLHASNGEPPGAT